MSTSLEHENVEHRHTAAQDETKKTLDSTQEKTATITLAFNLPDAAPYATYLRKTMCNMLEAMGVPDEEIGDLETMMGELSSNAARHAKGENYLVKFELHGDKATITVKDNGVGFDPEKLAAAGTVRPDELSSEGGIRIGGFGLPLVYTLADEVKIARNVPTGMVVQAQKTVHSLQNNESDSGK